MAVGFEILFSSFFSHRCSNGRKRRSSDSYQAWYEELLTKREKKKVLNGLFTGFLRLYKFGNDEEITFDKLLEFPPFKEQFRKFCVEKLCEENLDFLDVVAKFQSDSTSSPDEMFAAARVIFDNYIKPNSKYELNIDGAYVFPLNDIFTHKKPVRKEIFDQIRGLFLLHFEDKSSFSFADSILKLLEFSILPEFFKTHALKQIIPLIQRRNEGQLKKISRTVGWAVFVVIHSLALLGKSHLHHSTNFSHIFFPIRLFIRFSCHSCFSVCPTKKTGPMPFWISLTLKSVVK